MTALLLTIAVWLALIALVVRGWFITRTPRMPPPTRSDGAADTGPAA